ncbi:hypothetical protein ACUTHT_28820, partial [Klebsiella pneumoniae]|uniref:hypothetical protein n=1 Tax=Klebsiella pneumoniae TaxID=573 RepID=UPI0040453ACC
TLVQADSNKFYSYSQFNNAMTANVNVGSYSVPGIQNLMDSRVSFLNTSAEFIQSSPSITSISSAPQVVSYLSPVNISAKVT